MHISTKRKRSCSLKKPKSASLVARILVVFATISLVVVVTQLHQRLNRIQTRGDSLLSSSVTSPSLQFHDDHKYSRSDNEINLYNEKPDSSGTYTFNTIPIKRVEGLPPPSKSYCVQPEPRKNTSSSQNDIWMYRSCRYTNLCWDSSTLEYVVYSTDDDDDDDEKSTVQVALGGINPRWNVGQGFDRGSWKVRWEPQKRVSSHTTERHQQDYYYALPPDVVLLPFHSMAGHNVGHLLWDDLYAIYTLLRIFGYENHKILPIRQVLKNATLYANCDIRRNKRLGCRTNFAKFWPVLGVNPDTFSTSKDIQLSIPTTTTKPALVCSHVALVGTGLLTDHGLRDHGWDYLKKAPTKEAKSGRDLALLPPHNLGRGRLFYDFRNFMLRNYYPNQESLTMDWPPQITFSLRSSRDWARRLNFTTQMLVLESKLSSSSYKYSVASYDMRELSLTEQMRVAGTTSIFITTCGGGSMTATFLPRGATLIVYFDAHGGFDFETMTPNQQPARLDWDLLNNAAHLRVHWLPVNTMDTPDDVQLFNLLIQHELAIIHRNRDVSFD